jgi:amidase
VGSDGGGSIRIPAHFTGIAGLKPTPGRVSAAGHLPEVNHPGGLLSVAGPLARNARDLKALFEVLAGYDPEDPFSAPVQSAAPLQKGARIGVMPQFMNTPVQASIREAVLKAASSLQTLGFNVEEFQPRDVERAPNLWAFFFSDLPARLTKERIAGREDQAHWTATEFLESSLKRPEPSSRHMLDALGDRDRMRLSVLRQMRDVPVLLLPPCGIPAFKHRERRWATETREIGLFQAMMPATTFNLLGFPALVIPWTHTEEGLPIGIQLVGRPWEEETLLELAIALEDARGPLATCRTLDFKLASG